MRMYLTDEQTHLLEDILNEVIPDDEYTNANELKKDYIGQIHTYMNYIDKNKKSIDEFKTIGIIICKKENKFIMEYCSDERVYRTTYILN